MNTHHFDGRSWTAQDLAALHRPQKFRFQWLYDDGGRAATGRRGQVSDCVCRAIAIANGEPYEQVYRLLERLCKPFRTSPNSRKPSNQFGIPDAVYAPYLIGQGWKFHSLPKGAQFNAAHVPLEGCSIVPTRGHICAVKHGVIRDTYDCSYGGTVWIKGFYRRT